MEVKSYVKGVEDVSKQILRILNNPEFDENTCLWQIEEAVKAHLERADKIRVTMEAWA